MKKLISIAILFVMIVALSATMVNAATSETLPDELYAIGSAYGMTQNDKIKMEQYLRDYPLSEEKCNEILELAKEAEQIMVENNTTDVKTLSKDLKARLRELATEAATIAGVTLDFKTNRIDVYKDGEHIYTVKDQTNLVQTGSSNLVYVVLAGIAIIAIAGTVVVKKVRS